MNLWIIRFDSVLKEFDKGAFLVEINVYRIEIRYGLDSINR
jgi:hypothetical protein